MEEIWKTIDWIPNLRGTYEVSNLGNVRRTSMIWYDNKKQTYRTIYRTKNLRKYNNGHGYVHVTFPLNTGTGSKYKNFYIHKLVAIAFIPNPLNKPEINHKNFVRADNMATNLEWCTHEENDAHKMSMDKRLKPKYPSGCRKEQRQTQKVNKKKLSKPLKSSNVSNPILLSYRSSKKPIQERNIYFEHGKYTVRIGYNKKKIYVGRYENYDDAVYARTKKLKELRLIDF